LLATTMAMEASFLTMTMMDMAMATVAMTTVAMATMAMATVAMATATMESAYNPSRVSLLQHIPCSEVSGCLARSYCL